MMRLQGRLYNAATITAVLLTSASEASADPVRIPLGAFSGTERVVQFDVSAVQPLPYFENGATFTYSDPFAYVQSINQSLNLWLGSDSPASNTLTVTFSEPVTMVGFKEFRSAGLEPLSLGVALFGDPAGLQPLGALNLGTFPGPDNFFFGFHSTSPFTRVDITGTRGDAFTSWFIDDFRFDNAAPVPEPGTVTLTLLGVGIVGSRIRRCLRRAGSLLA